MAITFVSGDRRLIDLATPLKAGARAECQNGKITTSTPSSHKIILAVLRQELGEIESSGADFECGGVDVPDLTWVTPGNKMVGYWRLQLKQFTLCPSALRAIAIASLNCAIPPRYG